MFIRRIFAQNKRIWQEKMLLCREARY